MDAKEFVRLNEELGHTIQHTLNCSWMIREDKSALALPTLENVFPSPKDISALFSHGVRYVAFKTEMAEKNTYEYTFSGNDYDLEKFDSKIRNQIRKGLKTCTIVDVALVDLVEQGFIINVRTLAKHGRHVRYLEVKKDWEHYITVLFHKKDVYIKGAYVDGHLIAYVIFIKVKDKYYIYHPFTNFEYSSANPMNAILFTFINGTLEKEAYINISYGMASIDEKPGLDKFKKGMLFSAKESTRVFVVMPLLRILVNEKARVLLRIVSKIIPRAKPIQTKYECLLKNKQLFQHYIEFYYGKATNE